MKLLTLLILLFSFNSLYSEYDFQDADIIFQVSKSSQSEAIQFATHSKYSHMGIIFFMKGKCYVFEAIQPVSLTPVEKWMNRGLDGHFVVKRLKNASSILTAQRLKQFKKVGKKFEGKNYDLYFEWSDDKIYCSELVWKLYYRVCGIEIGKLKTIKDFDLSNSIVKKMMKKRYGNKIPMDEKVISPVDMFDSDTLITVYSN